MSTSDVSLRVETEYGDRPIIGADTTIFKMVPDFYVQVEGEPALAAVQFLRFVRKVATDQAADLGERLHHADFYITADPEVVREKGILHDCQECRDGLQAALVMMAEQPGEEMVVGQLFWSA